MGAVHHTVHGAIVRDGDKLCILKELKVVFDVVVKAKEAKYEQAKYERGAEQG